MEASSYRGGGGRHLCSRLVQRVENVDGMVLKKRKKYNSGSAGHTVLFRLPDVSDKHYHFKVILLHSSAHLFPVQFQFRLSIDCMGNLYIRGT